MGEGKVRDYTFSLPFSLPYSLKSHKKIYAPVPPPISQINIKNQKLIIKFINQFINYHKIMELTL